MKVGYIYDPIYLRHDTGQHVENARRLEAVTAHLEKTGLKDKLKLILPRAASVEELASVHHSRHISYIREVAARGGGWLDADTLMSADSYEAAIYAAGGLIRGTEAVVSNEVDSAFALVRPPGHHATFQRAMGFCLFNNVAIATKYALTNSGLRRIAIIDFDVHHGNGTQDAFYYDPQVLYISTHQAPFYPGTGGAEEIGAGEGEGTTVNIPLPSGCGDAEYLEVFKQIVVPAIRGYKPELILVSAGYDLHWADELALMQVTLTGFVQMAEIIKGLADELCQGRLVFTLEGGYNLAALSSSVGATFEVLLGNDDIKDTLGKPPYPVGAPNIAPIIRSIKEIHQLT